MIPRKKTKNVGSLINWKISLIGCSMLIVGLFFLLRKNPLYESLFLDYWAWIAVTGFSLILFSCKNYFRSKEFYMDSSEQFILHNKSEKDSSSGKTDLNK